MGKKKEERKLVREIKRDIANLGLEQPELTGNVDFYESPEKFMDDVMSEVNEIEKHSKNDEED